MNRPLVIAHRGAAGHEVENSLAAFRAAKSLGADAIELDVHATIDGRFVVHHNNMVDKQHISHCTAEEIREHRLANGEPIPILEDALAMIVPALTAFVEPKRLSPESDEKLLAVIEACPAPQRVAVHAFDHRIIRRMGERRPLMRRGVISGSYPVNPVRCLEDADAQALWQEWPFIDEALVEAIHRAGAIIYAWTVDRREDMDLLLDLGVDGLVTDFPDVGREVVDARSW